MPYPRMHKYPLKRFAGRKFDRIRPSFPKRSEAGHRWGFAGHPDFLTGPEFKAPDNHPGTCCRSCGIGIKSVRDIGVIRI